MQPLTPTEELYLNALREAPEGVSRKSLASVKAPPAERMSNMVDVHVKNLRRKLPPNMRIELVRGFGYKLVEEV